MKTKQKAQLKKKNSSSMSLANSQKLQLEVISQKEEQIKRLEEETTVLKVKNKGLKIDKNILMKMIKDMIDKNPENLKVIDQEKFMKTLEDP